MNITLHIDGKPVTLENVERKAQAISFIFAGKTYQFHGHRFSCVDCTLEREKTNGVLQRMSGTVWQAKGAHRVQLGAIEASITELPKGVSHAAGKAALSPCAPMPGLIRQILVKKGDKVKQGQPLVVMEAMKLQTTLAAGDDGKVEAVLVKKPVTASADLVKIK